MASLPVNEGDVLFGKYRIERLVGSGGMGIVYSARHEQLDQLVAIKFIREDVLGHPDAAVRFLHEARAAAKLKGEHVTRVLDVGLLESGAPYMIMEFLEGSDLEKILADSGPMQPTRALELFRQACIGLTEAHAAGIVHRDIKPQNLFLTKTANGSPRLKVLDFGISKTFEIANQAGRVTGSAMLGSPVYMAPEQMQSSRDVDARADVWSLGVVLFELLTGHCPFEADTYPELCVKIATGEPRRVADLRGDVPPGVVSIVDRCLERDVSIRFAHAGEIVEALEALPPDILPPDDARGRAGRSTWSIVPDRGALPVEQAVEFVLQACVAVADAHALEMISPEHMKSARNVDSQTDLWAIGIILFELLTGKRPLLAESLPELFHRAGSEPPPPLRSFRPAVPVGLEAVILRCLEKDEQRRFRNVGELALALLPFAPKRATGSAEPISGIIQAVGLSASALAVPSSPQNASTQISEGTLPPIGRTTVGSLGRKKAVVGAGLAGAVGVIAIMGSAVFLGRAKTNHEEVSQTGAAAVTSPAVSPPPPAVDPRKPAEPKAVGAAMGAAPPVVPTTTPPVTAPEIAATPNKKLPVGAPAPPAPGPHTAISIAAAAPCKLVKTLDMAGEWHFSCPCAACR